MLEAMVGCKNDQYTYDQTLKKITAVNAPLKRNYRSAIAKRQKEFMVREARQHIFQTLENDLLEEWYGTEWDLNGYTEKPRQGKIACGYFVSIVLRDLGFNLNQKTLGQQASERIILSLVKNPDNVKRYGGYTIETFKKEVLKQGDGWYILGLDTHVGFVKVSGDNAYMIHASQGKTLFKSGVKKEKLEESAVVIDSDYRVIGKISAEDALIKKWLLNERIKIRTD